MQKTHQLSTLIGEIYDTVLDGSLWPEVMKNSACFVQGSVGFRTVEGPHKQKW